MDPLNFSEEICSIDESRTLCFRSHGEVDAETIVLVAGLGQQLNVWPSALTGGLVNRGFRVVTFDNRDVGRSFQDGAPRPTRMRFVTRRWDKAQYSIDDMAADTAGLIQELGIAPAHVVGMSMGGMIAQNLAATYPSRVASLTSVMSMTGAPRVGRPAMSTYLKMATPPAKTEAAYADALVKMMRHIGSQGFPFDEVGVREIAAEAWERGAGPAHFEGVERQLAAIIKSGDRTEVLREIDVPTLVIHGDGDRMVNPSGGRATAAAIRMSKLVSIEGMGHDIPAGAIDRLVDLIAEHASSLVEKSSEPELAATAS